MDKIAHFIDLFFDIHSSPEKRDMQLYTEKFIEVLKRRIRREENILFPAFERLQNNKFLGVTFDKRIADRRINDLRTVQSQHEEIDSSEIVNNRTKERRKRKRHPIYNVFVIYKREILFYIFILIVCIIVALVGIFVIHSPDNLSKISKTFRGINQEKKE